MENMVNNPNAPASLLTDLQMYGNRAGYKFVGSRYSAKTFNSGNLTQTVNTVKFFSDIVSDVGELNTNMVEPNKLPDNTGLLIEGIEIRALLRSVDSQASLTQQQISLFQNWLWECIVRVAPDQRHQMGEFPVSRHMPVGTFSGAILDDTGTFGAGSALATSSNGFASINIEKVPIPWEQRKILNTFLIAPAWTDSDSEIRVKIDLVGQEVQKG